MANFRVMVSSARVLAAAQAMTAKAVADKTVWVRCIFVSSSCFIFVRSFDPAFRYRLGRFRSDLHNNSSNGRDVEKPVHRRIKLLKCNGAGNLRQMRWLEIGCHPRP